MVSGAHELPKLFLQNLTCQEGQEFVAGVGHQIRIDEKIRGHNRNIPKRSETLALANLDIAKLIGQSKQLRCKTRNGSIPNQ